MSLTPTPGARVESCVGVGQAAVEVQSPPPIAGFVDGRTDWSLWMVTADHARLSTRSEFGSLGSTPTLLVMLGSGVACQGITFSLLGSTAFAPPLLTSLKS